MFKSSAVCFFLIVSVANCQFFYNYEEDRAEDPQVETQNYDQSAYQYNPPSTVNQQYLQPPSSESLPTNERGNRKIRIRVRSRNYQLEPDTNERELAPVVNSDIEQRAVRQERRQARRRQREDDYMIDPPRIYGPSIFENIGLGEAPNGVYIPSDSFLNVLRNQRSVAPYLNSQPQTTNYARPSVENAPRYFVKPPSNDEPSQPNLILPATRPEVEYANTPLPQTNVAAVRSSPRLQARTVRGNKRSRPRIRMQPEYAAPPTVDIDALRENRDDFARDDIMPKLQYVPVTTRQISRSQNRPRTVRNYQRTTPAPRIYSPSIFENVGLGEAPTGVYVPEDSLLNVLRSPTSNRQEQPIISASHSSYSVPNEYEEEIIESPPPPPQKRRSSQRSSSRRSQSQNYPNEEYQNIQPVQPSSHQRSQNRRSDFEDFERQKPAVRQRIESPPRPALRTQIQSSSVDMSQSTFRAAKLAIAELPQDTDDDGIPGEAGVNYPTLHVIPKTSFSCAQQPHNGYYADLETSCQVVHLCQSGGVQDSFLCPNGTIFSQEKFSCQWWYKVNCNDAPRYYVKNDELYKVPEKKERKRN